MRYYLDTEFIERGYDRIELISIGIVAEDGLEFYAVASDGWDESHAGDWVKANVLPYLGPGKRLSRADLAKQIALFVGNRAPELWGYFSDYDWVLLCQLFGTMMDLPEGWPKFCLDVKQLAVSMGNPRLPKQAFGEHNALADARHIKAMHEFLMASNADGPRPLEG